MFGFGKKKEPVDSMPALAVSTIPADFYAGKNPVVGFTQVPQGRATSTAGTAPAMGRQTGQPPKSTSQGGMKRADVGWLTSRKTVLMVSAGLFIVFIIGATAYYAWSARRNAQSTLPPPPQLTPEPTAPSPPTPPEAAPTVTEPVATEPTTTPAETKPPSLLDAPLSFPSELLGDSADLDQDGITDVEEELFRTDPANPDSDSDHYSDSHEIYNLYNPIGKEPLKIIDSGLVKEFANPVFGYSVYYPASWAVGNVDENYRDVLFSTITGENIEARVYDLGAGETFTDWFAQSAPAEKFGDLIEFGSVFKERGYRRKDWLVYYFVSSEHVVAVAYHTTDSSLVNYRSVIKMIARSFRMSTTPAVIIPPASEINPTNTLSATNSAPTSTSL